MRKVKLTPVSFLGFRSVRIPFENLSANPLATWTALLILTILVFRRERHREPSFIPPPAPQNGASYTNVLAHDERYADKPQDETGFDAQPIFQPASGVHGYSQPAAQMQRPSMDTYAPPMKEEPSRTMQLASNDPCEWISHMKKDDR